MATGKTILGLAALIAVASAVSSCEERNQRAQDVARQEASHKERERRLAAMTPEQRYDFEAEEADRKRAAAETAERIDRKRAEQAAQEKARGDRVIVLAGAVKKASREPESFKIRQAFATDDGETVCIEYSGRNGFGGISVEFVIQAGNKVHHNDAAQWNRHCAGGRLHDYTGRIALY